MNFVKENFDYSGGFLTYLFEGKREFVARFKYSGPITMGKFKKELMKNHSPATYFEAAKKTSPLDVLKTANLAWYVDTMNAYYIKRSGRPVMNADGTHIRSLIGRD